MCASQGSHLRWDSLYAYAYAYAYATRHDKNRSHWVTPVCFHICVCVRVLASVCVYDKTDRHRERSVRHALLLSYGKMTSSHEIWWRFHLSRLRTVDIHSHLCLGCSWIFGNINDSKENERITQVRNHSRTWLDSGYVCWGLYFLRNREILERSSLGGVCVGNLSGPRRHCCTVLNGTE